MEPKTKLLDQVRDAIRLRHLGDFLKRTSLVVVHGGVDRRLASPQRGEVGGGTRRRYPSPRPAACRTTPHLASPRWEEVIPHSTGWEAGDQVWRGVENLFRKSP